MEPVRGDNPWGRRTIFLDRVDSTNSRLIELARSGVPEGTVLVAEQQTAGRGRQGRSWYSPPGGLWMSLLLRPPAGFVLPGGLPLLAGLAVACALEECLGISPGLKWPNDILLGEGKAGGILVEAGEEGGGRFVVVGIGLNVAVEEFPAELDNTAVSLELDSSRGWRRALLRVLLRRFRLLYLELLKKGSLAGLLGEYSRRSVTLGRLVVVSTPSGAWRGKAVGLTPAGELIVEDAAGIQRTVCSGEVSIRPAKKEPEG